MNSNKLISLNEDEEVYKVIRRYWLNYFFAIFVTFILITLPFILIVPLFQRGRWGMGLFFIILIFGLLSGLRTFISWYYNVFIVTSQRVIDIDQRGFFNKVVWDTELDRIHDITYSKKGIWQTIFNYGNVQILTSGSLAKIEIINIKQPQKIKEAIKSIREEAKDGDLR
ncbi:MAG TPA: PH domain-containing protein [Patescibacteria group bacterium]